MEAKIIKFVQANPMLYDKNYRSTKYTELKNAKWQELSNEIHVPAPALKRRWKTLRDKYYRDRRTKTDPLFEYKWKYYQLMNFLDNFDSFHENTLKFENEDTQLEPEIEYAPDTSQQSSTNEFSTFSQLINVTEDTSTPSNVHISSTRSFFLSLAIQIEEANLPQENFFRLQKRLMDIVHDEIRQCNR